MKAYNIIFNLVWFKQHFNYLFISTLKIDKYMVIKR